MSSSIPELKMTGVFLSYSRKDRRWVERIIEVLRPLIKGEAISLWYDAEINPGENWREAIKKALYGSEIAILLLSANYFSSKLAEAELPLILERVKQKQLRIFSMVTSPIPPSVLGDFPQLYNLINEFSEPLSILSESQRKKVFTNLSKSIYRALPLSPGLNKESSMRHKTLEDRYSAALNTAIENIGGDVGGSNILGDGNIFFEAEERLAKNNER